MVGEKLKKYFDLKDGLEIEDLLYLRPHLLMIVVDAIDFADRHDCGPLVITSLFSDRKPGTGKSKTHPEGRGCDLRIWNIPKDLQKRLVDYLNLKYADKFGTGPNPGVKRLVAILKKDHIHLQCARY